MFKYKSNTSLTDDYELPSRPRTVADEDGIDLRSTTQYLGISQLGESSSILGLPQPSPCGSTHQLIHDLHRDVLARARYIDYFRAWCRIRGPELLFLAMVVGFQIALGVWQCYEYSTNAEDQAAFGWGVAMAKGCAGALYPTLFFMLMSMSRWVQIAMTRFNIGTRFINWDKKRSFHIRLALCAMVLTFAHSIGHLTGSFIHASQEQNHAADRQVLGNKINGLSYGAFVTSRPGWTGIAALIIFITISFCSINFIRTRWFEVFQCCHLMFFPMAALLMAHGSSALLQYPALAFVVMVPTTLVLFEKLSRAFQLTRDYRAIVENLNEDMVRITTDRGPRWRTSWFFMPGQFAFLQIPRISKFEWHPFTVARISNDDLCLYVKTSGKWTRRLGEKHGFERVCLDGPFSAPAQRFFHYDHNIMIGLGAGITPSLGILDALLNSPGHRWTRPRSSGTKTGSSGMKSASEKTYTVDFHWALKTCSGMLPIFQPLYDVQNCSHNSLVDMNATIQLTGSEKLQQAALENMDTACSAGAVNEISPSSSFSGNIERGRPNFGKILVQHYEKMRALQQDDALMNGYIRSKPMKIGVFYCGAANVKPFLRRLCLENTLRGILDHFDIEYHFHPEVF